MAAHAYCVDGVPKAWTHESYWKQNPRHMKGLKHARYTSDVMMKRYRFVNELISTYKNEKNGTSLSKTELSNIMTNASNMEAFVYNHLLERKETLEDLIFAEGKNIRRLFASRYVDPKLRLTTEQFYFVVINNRRFERTASVSEIQYFNRRKETIFKESTNGFDRFFATYIQFKEKIHVMDAELTQIRLVLFRYNRPNGNLDDKKDDDGVQDDCEGGVNN